MFKNSLFKTMILIVIAMISLSSVMALPSVYGQEDDEDEFGIEFEVTGVVEEIIEDDLLIVAGYEIDLPQSLNINNLDISVGDTVMVLGVMDEEGVIEAQDVTVEERAEATSEDEGEEDDDRGNGNGNGRGNGNNSGNNGNGRGNGNNGNNGNNNNDDNRGNNGRGNDNDNQPDVCPQDDDAEEDNDDRGNGNGNGRGNGNNGNNGNNNGNGRGRNNPSHPLNEILEEEFDVDAETIIEWRCEGYGLGEIVRALLIAEETGDAAEDILARRDDGEGWGQILASYDLKPSDIAPGTAISNVNGRGNGNNSGNNGNGNNN